MDGNSKTLFYMNPPTNRVLVEQDNGQGEYYVEEYIDGRFIGVLSAEEAEREYYSKK